MKANEVRIGNLVEYIDDIDHSQNREWKLNKINEMDIDILFHHAPHHNYRGIQLTEEWLLKLGFLQCRENTAGKTYAIYIDGIRFDDTMIVLWSSTGLFWRKNMVMESVHQIQNLYFGLTGQELELNGEAFLK